MGRALFLFLSLFNSPAIALSHEAVISRTWDHLSLGDGLEQIQIIYRPSRDWPSYMEPKWGVSRIRLERSSVKAMPRPIEVLWLGMKKGRLVRLEVMYEEGAVPLGKLVDRLSSDYGPPRREEGDYWWSDGQTALRVFAVKGRTSAELMNVEQM